MCRGAAHRDDGVLDGERELPVLRHDLSVGIGALQLGGRLPTFMIGALARARCPRLLARVVHVRNEPLDRRHCPDDESAEDEQYEESSEGPITRTGCGLHVGVIPCEGIHTGDGTPSRAMASGAQNARDCRMTDVVSA